MAQMYVMGIAEKTTLSVSKGQNVAILPTSLMYETLLKPFFASRFAFWPLII